VKPIETSLAEIIKASGRSPHQQAGQTTVLINRRKKRQKCLAMQEPSTEVFCHAKKEHPDKPSKRHMIVGEWTSRSYRRNH
jgi:hypothetical protein